MDKRFTLDIISAAQSSMAKWGVPASVSLAQWALESAYGKSMPAGSNNPFGIKATAGQDSVSAPTWEEVSGQRVNTTAHFRKFASLADAFDQHAKLLATSHYYTAAMAQRNNPDRFAEALTGVYATDHSYGAKLTKIMQDNDLYSLDTHTPPNFPTTPTIATRDSVTVLQNALKGLGYSPGAIDGWMGPNTLKAISAIFTDYNPRPKDTAISAVPPPKDPATSPAPSAPAQAAKPPMKEPPMSTAAAAPQIDIFQGLVNTFTNLAKTIGASAKVIADPSVTPTTTSGQPIDKISATVADAQKAEQEVMRIIADVQSKNIVDALEACETLMKLVFGALDRWGIDVPVVTQVVESFPDLDPVN